MPLALIEQHVRDILTYRSLTEADRLRKLKALHAAQADRLARADGPMLGNQESLIVIRSALERVEAQASLH